MRLLGRIRRFLGFATALAAAIGGAGPLHSQTATGKIEGRVSTPSGEPIVQAQVFIVGTSYHTVTSVRGYYFMLNIPAGRVTVRAASVGHKATEILDLRVFAGNTLTQDIVLEPSPFRAG